MEDNFQSSQRANVALVLSKVTTLAASQSAWRRSVSLHSQYVGHRRVYPGMNIGVPFAPSRNI